MENTSFSPKTHKFSALWPKCNIISFNKETGIAIVRDGNDVKHTCKYGVGSDGSTFLYEV